MCKDAEEDGRHREAQRRRMGPEGGAAQRRRMDVGGRRGAALENAFGERGMTNLHRLSPTIQFASSVCVVY
jgi:hypothetical protein